MLMPMFVNASLEGMEFNAQQFININIGQIINNRDLLNIIEYNMTDWYRIDNIYYTNYSYLNFEQIGNRVRISKYYDIIKYPVDNYKLCRYDNQKDFCIEKVRDFIENKAKRKIARKIYAYTYLQKLAKIELGIDDF